MKAQKLPRNRKCIFNKSANVESVKPQLVTSKAQNRQCQSYAAKIKARKQTLSKNTKVQSDI